jgi:hypothetical protein
MNEISESILKTYYKIIDKRVIKKQDISYVTELSAKDHENIERVVKASAILSGMGNQRGTQYDIVRCVIEDLIGNKNFSNEFYRFFLDAYNDVLEYQKLENDLIIQKLIAEEEQKNTASR